ncbi:carboxypeptidase-like regulatory domain-containing protein [Nonlabens sp. Asnod2-A12]|uniref:carboxypeptidase-like regulatory domain-containing protein n=1 Tax=Nonlabens sp. Asnod2-A12 TaxID=3160578 RepID=UPI00386B0215
MKNILLLLILACGVATAQKERVQIQGVINSVTNEPLEGVAVFNQASLEGTISNKEGGFFLHARKGDKISFKALQFESFSLIITAKVMENKKATISLNEGVNQLDEVVLDDGLMRIDVKRTPYVDPKINEVSDYNQKTRAVDRIENTFSDRIKQPEEYAIRNEAFKQSQPRFNMINIIGGLVSMAILGTLDGLNLNTGSAPETTEKEFDVYVLKNKYSTEYLLNYLEIPQKDLYEFMHFAKDKGLNESMFEPERELDLLQFLSNQVTLFKEKKNYPEKKEGFSPSVKEKSNEK